MLSFLPFAPAGPHGVDPLVLLGMALLAEAIFGGFPVLFRVFRHPLARVEGAVDWLDRKLNREQRSEGTRAFRGLLALVAVIVAAAVLGLAVAWLSRNHPFGWIVEFPLIVALVAQRGPYERVRAVAGALDDNLEAARGAVAPITPRDPEGLDFHGVARAALESLARDLGEGAVAPAFWYALFGAPGLFVVRAVGAMNARIGHATPRHRAFGRWCARAHGALEFFPARFAGLFLVLAAPFARNGMARFGAALKVMLRDAGKHHLSNAGWPVAAMAGALGLALAGPRRYREIVADDPWIGDGTARASSGDVRRGLRLYTAACAVNVVLVGCLALVR
jgi:adenosylcobinamide-phosphate synthase